MNLAFTPCKKSFSTLKLQKIFTHAFFCAFIYGTFVASFIIFLSILCAWGLFCCKEWNRDTTLFCKWPTTLGKFSEYWGKWTEEKSAFTIINLKHNKDKSGVFSLTCYVEGATCWNRAWDLTYTHLLVQWWFFKYTHVQHKDVSISDKRQRVIMGIKKFLSLSGDIVIVTFLMCSW